MVPCISTSMNTSERKSVHALSAAATPRNFPHTKTGRLTGLETTVRTVRLSISRLSALVAKNPASRVPHTKMVESAMSTNIRWSSINVKPLKGILRIMRSVPATMTANATGWRTHSMAVLRAMAQSCSRKFIG